MEKDYVGVVYAKTNFYKERELWLRPRVSGPLLGETKLWPSMDSTSNATTWQP
jgi:hypothetical protein